MLTKVKHHPSDLTEHIGFWMRLVSNEVSYSFARKLESSQVTVAEWVVLRKMYDSDEITSPSLVAELTGLTRGAVSKLVERLLQKGFVMRSESKEDRRYQDIRLTQLAVNLIPKLAQLADQNDEEFFKFLSQTERNTLTKILKKISKLNNLKNIPLE